MEIINWHTVMFMLFALMACAFAVAVVVTSNIVRMAFYLVLSLSATAGLFFLAGSDFVGAMQIMIYVGGTLVLLIFGVMLTAQGPFISMRTGAGEWLLSLLVGGSLLAVLVSAAISIPQWRAVAAEDQLADARVTTARLGLGLLGSRVDQLEQTDKIKRQGMSGYLLPFEIVSVHLLVVLIGAAYLARPKKRISAVTEEVMS